MPSYIITHNNKIPLISESYLKIAEWDFRPFIWYDYNLATASVDTASKNTITSGAYTRLWDAGTTSLHLTRTAALSIASGFTIVSPTYSFDATKSKYSGLKNSEGLSGYLGYPGLASTQSSVNKVSNELTMFVIYKTSQSAMTPINVSDIFTLANASYSVGISHIDGEIYAGITYQSSTFSATGSYIASSYSTYYSIVATFSSNGHNLSRPFLRLSGSTASLAGAITPLVPYNYVQGNYAKDERLMEIQVYNSILPLHVINQIEQSIKTKWSI